MVLQEGVRNEEGILLYRQPACHNRLSMIQTIRARPNNLYDDLRKKSSANRHILTVHMRSQNVVASSLKPQ